MNQFRVQLFSSKRQTFIAALNFENVSTLFIFISKGSCNQRVINPTETETTTSKKANYFHINECVALVRVIIIDVTVFSLNLAPNNR